MERNVYTLIQDMHELVSRNDKRILTSNEISALQATLRTLLVVFAPDDHDITEPVETRRPPAKTQKKHWWQMFLG